MFKPSLNIILDVNPDLCVDSREVCCELDFPGISLAMRRSKRVTTS